MKKIGTMSLLLICVAAMAAGQVSVSGFTAGNAISAAVMNANFAAINAQFTHLDSSHWAYAPGSPTLLGYTGTRMGIGTTSPGTRMHVYDNIANFTMIIENQNESDTGYGLAIKAGKTIGSTEAWLLAFYNPHGDFIGGVKQNGAGSILRVDNSDIRLKKNIMATRYSLADVMNIKVHDYNFKDDAENLRQTGFIAQELYGVYPEAVAKPAKESDSWGVDYSKLTPILVKAIQDQQKHIDSLQAENTELKKRLASIEQKLGLK